MRKLNYAMIPDNRNTGCFLVKLMLLTHYKDELRCVMSENPSTENPSQIESRLSR